MRAWRSASLATIPLYLPRVSADNFAMRQFTDPTYTGTKVVYDPQEFEDKVGTARCAI